MGQLNENEINWAELCSYLIKRLWIAIIAAIVCAAVGYLAANILPIHEYTASTEIYVHGVDNGSTTYEDDVHVFSHILSDLHTIATDQHTVEEAIRRAGASVDPVTLLQDTEVTIPGSSRLLYIAVTASDPELAATLANNIRDITTEQMDPLVGYEFYDVVYTAEAPASPNVSPTTYIIQAGGAGLYMVLAFFTVSFLRTSPIRTEEDVQRCLGMETLGILPTTAELASRSSSIRGGKYAGNHKRRTQHKKERRPMQSNGPIRILHIVGRMDRGGIETMLMNIYRNIDRDKVQFDFLAHYGREAAYNDEIRALGGRIYEMPALKTEDHVYYYKLFEYVAALHRFFKEHPEYRIIHGHMTNTASIYMPIARKYGVTCRISHSHNTHGKPGLLGHVTNCLQRPIHKHATDWFACSEAAAKWFYPKTAFAEGKVKIIANAVDARTFRYNESIRQKKRAELGADGKLVIGCVARFRPEKNQAFLLQVLQEILKTRKNALLLFVGDGPCEPDVVRQTKECGLEKYVLSLGQRDDVPELMQAMDVFVLPSLWEGLPLVGIEAQASGLPCIVSDGVTAEMNAINMVEYLSLQAPLSRWAQAIIQAAEQPREDTYEHIIAAGFDIHTTVPWLQDFYLSRG